MSGIVAKLNAKTPTKPKIINLHLDGFDIRFDYDSFSSKSIVTMSYGVSIKMEGSDLAVRLELKENEILRGPTPTESPFTTNMHIIQNELVGDARAPLLPVVPVKSRYGGTTCVTYEQTQFLPLSRSIIQTMEINISSDTDELVSFVSEKSIVTLAFGRNFTDALITSI